MVSAVRRERYAVQVRRRLGGASRCGRYIVWHRSTRHGNRRCVVSGRKRAADAATRIERAVAVLRHEAESATNDSARWLVGYDAATLLWRVLLDLRSLVDLLSDEVGFDSEPQARALYETLRARRLAAKLEQVEGRTPEEAAAFLAKASELRRPS